MGETPLRRATPVAIGLTATALAVGVGLVIGWNPAVGLGGLVALAYLVIALSSFPVALALWVPSFFMPFYTVGNAWLKWGLAVAGIALVGALGANRGAPLRSLAARSQVLLAAAAFLGWLAFSILWAGRQESAASEWLAYLLCIGIFLGAIVAVRSLRDARLLVVAFVVAGVASAAMGLTGIPGGTLDSAAVDSVAGGRISAGAGDPNVLAAALLATAVLAASLAASARAGARAISVGSALLCVVAIAATQSRGGLLAAVATVVVGGVVFRTSRSRALLGALLAAGALVAYFAVYPAAAERVTDFDDEGSGRADLWRVGWRAFTDEPVVGIGLNQFRVQSSDYVLDPGTLQFVEQISERPLVVHNTYLQFLAETGVIGFALFAVLVALSLGAARRAAALFDLAGRHDDAVLTRGVIVAVLGMLVAGFFFSAALDYKIWLLLGICVGLLTVAEKSDPDDLRPTLRPGA